MTKPRTPAVHAPSAAPADVCGTEDRGLRRHPDTTSAHRVAQRNARPLPDESSASDVGENT